MDDAGRLTRLCSLVVAVAAAVGPPTPCEAHEPYGIVTSVSSATTVDQQSVRDTDLVSMRLDGGGVAVLKWIGDLLPQGVDVDAVSCLDDNSVVFSTSVSFSTDDVQADDDDLVLYNGILPSLLFDGAAAGLPTVADIDALHVVSTNPLTFYYSLDASVDVDGTVFADDDIVLYDQGAHTLAQSGSDMFADQAARADVDALWVNTEATEFVVSVDVSIAGSTGRTAAEDEDLVRWVADTLQPFVAGANVGLNAPGLDVDAVHVETSLFADGFETGNHTRWSSTIP